MKHKWLVQDDQMFKDIVEKALNGETKMVSKESREKDSKNEEVYICYDE